MSSSSSSSSSSTTVQSSCIEPGSGSSASVPLWFPAPRILRHSEIKKCRVTGFVNFVEAQPSVGRFKAEDHEAPTLLPMAASPPRVKSADVVAQTIAPECNYGVFHPVERGPAATREEDLRG